MVESESETGIRRIVFDGKLTQLAVERMSMYAFAVCVYLYERARFSYVSLCLYAGIECMTQYGVEIVFETAIFNVYTCVRLSNRVSFHFVRMAGRFIYCYLGSILAEPVFITHTLSQWMKKHTAERCWHQFTVEKERTNEWTNQKKSIPKRMKRNAVCMNARNVRPHNAAEWYETTDI